MTARNDVGPASWTSTAAAVAVVLVFQLRALLSPALGAIHLEETFDAAVAEALPWAPTGGALALQYRSFCGGCTLEAWAASALFRALPPTVATWRLLALATTALLAATTFRALHRAVGGRGAWTAIALLAVPPVTTSALLLRSWGNHVEASVLGLVALAVAASGTSTVTALAAGLIGALALAVGLTAGPFVVATLGLVASRRQARPTVAAIVGLAAVGAWWAVVIAAQQEAPWTTLGAGGFAPEGEGTADRIASLLAPERLGRLLGRLDHGSALPGLATAGALVLSTGWALRSGPPVLRAAAVALLAWLAAFVLGPFGFDRSMGLPTPIDVRYATPMLLLLPWLVGGAVGSARRPEIAAVLLVAGLAGGVPGRSELFDVPVTDGHLRLEAADWPFFARMQALRAPDARAGWPCVGDDPTCLALRAHAAGVVAARRGEGTPIAPLRSWWAGFGGELGRGTPDGPVVARLAGIGARLDAAGVPPEHRHAALAEAAFSRWADAPFAQAVDDPTWRALAAAVGLRIDPCDAAARPPSEAPGLLQAWADAHAWMVRTRGAAGCAPTTIGWSAAAIRAWGAADPSTVAWLPGAGGRGPG